MTNIFRAISVCIVFICFLINPLSAEEAEEPEDVPLLGEDLVNGERNEAKEPANHPPKIVSLTSTPERPIAGVATQTDSKGIKVLAVIEAIATDADGDYPLEYKFVFYPSGDTLGYSQNNKVVIENGSSPGTQLVDVTVKDSRGEESETKSLWIFIQSAESAAASEDLGSTSSASEVEDDKDTGSVSTTSGVSTGANKDLLNCLCRCWERGDTYCSYNTTPYPVLKGGTESCGNLENGPCMCQGAIGCWRASLVTEGECHDRCVDLYGSPSDKKGSSSSSSDPAVPASLGFVMEEEPNDLIGDANEIVFASPVGVQGKITPAGDADFYKFYVESAGMLEVKMNQVPEEMKTRIDFYGKNFNWITRKDASNPGDQVTLLVDVPGAGQGFIAISDIDRKAHPSDYSFTADFLPAKDDGEPNNQVGDSTEIVFDQAVSAHICPVEDVDFYKFYVDSAGIMEVKLDQVPSDMKTRIDLYNKNFNWVTRKDASNAGDALDWIVDLPGPSAHYLAILDLDRKARSEPYSFQMIFQPAPDLNEPNNQIGDSKDIGLGQTVTGYICPVDDVDFYKIWVDTPAILEAKLEKVPSNMKVRIDLYGKNNNWITRADASNAGDAITLESDLAGPGAYYLAVLDLDRKAHTEEYQLMAVLRSA